MLESTQVSIIVPCYNHARFIHETLDSILSQTYNKWECIIINDGSTDNSEEIIKEFLLKDNRFKYFFKRNGGLSSARNLGLKHAQGELVLFLDSDDIILPAKIISHVIIFDDKNCDFSYSDYSYCSENNPSELESSILRVVLRKKYIHDIIINWEMNLSIPIHCIVYKRIFLFKNNISFNEQIPAKEDWDFHLKVFSKNPKYIYVDEITCLYRRSANSLSQNTSKMTIGAIAVPMLNYNNFNNIFTKLFLLFRFLYENLSVVIMNIKGKKISYKEIVFGHKELYSGRQFISFTLKSLIILPVVIIFRIKNILYYRFSK